MPDIVTPDQHLPRKQQHYTATVSFDTTLTAFKLRQELKKALAYQISQQTRCVDSHKNKTKQTLAANELGVTTTRSLGVYSRQQVHSKPATGQSLLT